MNKSLDFYIKWLATLTGLTLVILTSYDITPLNKYFGALTALLWFVVGVLWREPSMYIINIVFMIVYISGIIK
jgi:hypothetical protein